MSDYAKNVANTILTQLGGFSRLRVMIGLKFSSYSVNKENGNVTLTLRWTAKSKYKVCKITLNGNDLYDIELGNIRNMEYKSGIVHKDIYVDMMKGLIEKGTGLYLSI